MSEGFVIPVSPQRLCRFAAPAPLLDDREPEPERGDADDLAAIDPDRLKELLDQIPPGEADVVELVAKGCHQTDIGIILGGLTQAAVSARLFRARSRIRWLLGRVEVTDGELGAALERHLLKRKSKARVFVLLRSLLRTTSQTQTMMETGVAQTIIAHQWRAARKYLRAALDRGDLDESGQRVLQALDHLDRNWGIMIDTTVYAGGKTLHERRLQALPPLPYKVVDLCSNLHKDS